MRMAMPEDITSIARACYHAFIAKDRAAIEALIADDFRFSSPLDNGIDRESYFAICWPNSANTEGFEFVHMAADGEQVGRAVAARRATAHSFFVIAEGRPFGRPYSNHSKGD